MPPPRWRLISGAVLFPALVLLAAAPAAAQSGPPPLAPADTDPDAVFDVVEEAPVLIGGMRGLMARVRYPQMARRQRVQGRVPVRLVVERDGSVGEAECLRDPGAGLCEAALEALRTAWFEPGTVAGRPVRTRTTLDLHFRLRR